MGPFLPASSLTALAVELPGLSLLDWAIVALMGAGTGLAEIASRYHGDTLDALRKPASWVYMGLNLGAALLALVLIGAFEFDLGLGEEAVGSKYRWLRRFAAGGGAMVFLRSSLLTLKIDGKDVGVGPAGILTAFMSTTETYLDMSLARTLEANVSSAARGVSFAKAKDPLPFYCKKLRRNLTAEEEIRLDLVITDIEGHSEMTDEAKAKVLITELAKMFGFELLKQAIATHAGDIRVDVPDPNALRDEFQGISFAKARTELPRKCNELFGAMTLEQSVALADRLGEIDNSTRTDEEKALELGVVLTKIWTTAQVKQATQLLADQIR